MNNIYLSIEYIDYGEYVISGRKRGKKLPPVKKIEDWIKSKGILPRNKKGQFIKRKVAAYLIARSIAKKGVEPFDFTFPLYQDMNKLVTQIAKNLSKDIEKDIKINLENVQTSK